MLIMFPGPGGGHYQQLGFITVNYQLVLSNVYSHDLKLGLDIILYLLSIFATLGVGGVIGKATNRALSITAGVVEGIDSREVVMDTFGKIIGIY